MARPLYRHRQIGLWYLIIIGALIFSLAVIPSVIAGEWWVGAIIGVAFVLIYGAFGSLTTTVDDKELSVRFTFGWPRRVIAIKAIDHHEVARDRWYYGWGVRLIPGGMLYSVWGLDAVEVHYRDKKKSRDRMFRIGTDDARALDAAIAEAIAARP